MRLVDIGSLPRTLQKKDEKDQPYFYRPRGARGGTRRATLDIGRAGHIAFSLLCRVTIHQGVKCAMEIDPSTPRLARVRHCSTAARSPLPIPSADTYIPILSHILPSRLPRSTEEGV